MLLFISVFYFIILYNITHLIFKEQAWLLVTWVYDGSGVFRFHLFDLYKSSLLCYFILQTVICHYIISIN